MMNFVLKMVKFVLNNIKDGDTVISAAVLVSTDFQLILN